MIAPETMPRIELAHEMYPVCGVIESVQQTDEPGGPVVSLLPDEDGRFNTEGVATSDKITYTIVGNHPVVGAFRATGIVPTNDREDPPMKIIPAKVGTGVVGVVVNQVFMFTIIERCGREAACPPRPNP